MVVWVEVAFLENFLIDGVLLFLSLRLARVRVRPFRLFLSAAVGGAEAVLFPLFSLPKRSAYAVKFLGGALLPLLTVGEKRARPYIAATISFFALTFAFGGLLVAAYSFFGVERAEGNAFLVEQAPVALILSGLLLFAALVFFLSKAIWRYRAVRRSLVPCTLRVGERTVRCSAFSDSGNLLTFRGEPVCVATAAAVFALFGREAAAAGRISLTTVNGSRTSPVFACDELTVEREGKILKRRGVFLTVGALPRGEYELVISPALMEV